MMATAETPLGFQQRTASKREIPGAQKRSSTAYCYFYVVTPALAANSCANAAPTGLCPRHPSRRRVRDAHNNIRYPQLVFSLCVQASKLWASLAYQGRNSGGVTSGLDSKGSSPFALSTPATKPNPVQLVPETPASFGASVIARSKAQGVKVKPRRIIKRPSSFSSSSSSNSSSATTSDSELDPQLPAFPMESAMEFLIYKIG